MEATAPFREARRAVGALVRQVVTGLSLLCALVASSAGSVDAQIAVARGSVVPQSIREFAWRVIETRCDYASYERGQRSFWAYDVRARKIDTAIVYSIGIVADVTWRKPEPSAFIEMTIVDDGGIRLIALKSSFIHCAP